MNRTARVPFRLSEPVHRRLNSYALAASAAGVSAMALAHAAQAEIIYTKASLDCSISCRFTITGQERQNSFSFIFNSTATSSGDYARWMVLDGYQNPARAFVGGKTPAFSGLSFASALRAGVRIDAAELQTVANLWLREHTFRGAYMYKGQWANDGKGISDRYVGVKFDIGGDTHFGWIRLNVKLDEKGDPKFATKVTGYAYETTPNKPIVAGKTHGDGATLSRLAQGASGLTAWRGNE